MSHSRAACGSVSLSVTVPCRSPRGPCRRPLWRPSQSLPRRGASVSPPGCGGVNSSFCTHGSSLKSAQCIFISFLK